MNEFLMLTKALVSAAICARLYCYKWPANSQYRVGVTIAAYFMMVCSAAVAIMLATGNQTASKLFDIGIYSAVLILIVIARGNLAKILEIRHG